MGQSVTARAHTNIALVKYWGKQNPTLIIPYNSSLSMTLDHFYTDTTVHFSTDLTADQIMFNHQPADAKTAKQMSQFLDLIRQRAHLPLFAAVETMNHVPNAAGLASSASGYAALAAAGARAAGLTLNKRDLSRLARRGSGSATRSIYGGFVEWQRGTNDIDSYAIPVQEFVDWDIQMIAIVLNDRPKSITSRTGMANTVATSPYFSAWVKTAQAMIPEMKAAIVKKDINLVGRLAEQSAMQMHATTLSAVPPFTYFEPETLQAIKVVQTLRQQGVSCYYTMDAGPNVKVICTSRETPQILAALAPYFSPEQLLVAQSGPGVSYR
ncbi:diphosphomevalonate decarboxylase [Latilactobacillus graminis]|uniref:diphosphomevalonate decarboxylase n=2 Tax=Latilactobacillus graminis TaxID=60519 RepID=A0AA89I0E4_9LACO|nr:diphosphomevalonate decarboxylase [Latilactobacillus graminis]KRM22243.1 diphosphomevalonate decarboxylase [Latilactobacillus graminis DSM 20719]QFP79581.1 diphosphomevalonate decarboxylase [Latilactobacillus graminis]